MLLRLGVLLLSLQTISTQSLGERCSIKNSRSPRVCTKASQCASAMREFQITGIPPKYCKKANPGDARLVCCEENWRPQATRKPIEPTWEISENKRVSERKCSEYSKAVQRTITFIPLSLNPEARRISGAKCEYTGVELIVGGEDAKQGEFPHMAAIGWIDHGDIVFECGGSLISKRFVLTAGHCIYNPRKKVPVPSIVRLGEQNLDPVVIDGAKPIDVKIKTVHKHPEYASPKKYNDIALFELDEDVEFKTDIRPACLWTSNDFGTHEKAVATGWGANSSRGQSTKELQKVSLSLLQNDDCDILLIDARSRNWDGFRPTQMCAGELRGGKDTCQGDSGSPLQVVSQGNKCIFHIVGITSFGQSCARSGQPAVYTRVSSYLDWIESVVWPGE